MKPYLSLIIPYHNSEDTIGKLLDSVWSSKNAPVFEVIIVDDGSKNKLSVADCGLWVSKTRKQKRNVKVVRQANKGPAAARNRGAKEARGKFLVFLDSDVELFPDALHNLAHLFLSDPDVVAQTGVWVKEQHARAFFPNFKALRDWSYWINERDKSGYYYLFSTRIASIKKSVFLRLGGFDEKYPGALVEDIELTYRIARRYAIIFSPTVRVRHEFEGFWPIAKKYFLRAYYWTKLYAQRKKFDPVATTLQEAITTVSGVGMVSIGLLTLLLVLFMVGLKYEVGSMKYEVVRQIFMLHASCFMLLLSIHTFLVRKFLLFMYKEKGTWFAFRGFFTGLVLYCFIFAGAVWGKISNKIK